jgi:hypothetical protein
MMLIKLARGRSRAGWTVPHTLVDRFKFKKRYHHHPVVACRSDLKIQKPSSNTVDAGVWACDSKFKIHLRVTTNSAAAGKRNELPRGGWPNAVHLCWCMRGVLSWSVLARYSLSLSYCCRHFNNMPSCCVVWYKTDITIIRKHTQQ